MSDSDDPFIGDRLQDLQQGLLAALENLNELAKSMDQMPDRDKIEILLDAETRAFGEFYDWFKGLVRESELLMEKFQETDRVMEELVGVSSASSFPRDRIRGYIDERQRFYNSVEGLYDTLNVVEATKAGFDVKVGLIRGVIWESKIVELS